MDIGDTAERVRFLSTVAVDRTRKLAEIATRHGTPWYQRYDISTAELAGVSEGWYRQY